MSDKRVNIKLTSESDTRGFSQLNKEVRLAKDELIKTIQTFGQFSKETQSASQHLIKAQSELRNAKQQVKEFGEQTKMSKFQLLEFGENLTVVAAGIIGAIKLVADFTGKIYELGKSGARFEVLKDNFKGGEEALELFRKATANTVTDAGLIKLSNQASDLGVSLNEQAMLFSLAEDAADKYGGSVEENFSKVVMATEGNVKGLKALGIQKELFNQKVTELVKGLGGETEAIQGSNGESELSIKKLDAETQKRIRVQAILELTGSSLEKVTQKEMDVADKMEAVNVKFENLKEKIGAILAKNITKEFDSINKSLENLGISGENGQSALLKIVNALTEVAIATNIVTGAIKLMILAFDNKYISAAVQSIKDSYNWLLNVTGIGGKNTGIVEGSWEESPVFGPDISLMTKPITTKTAKTGSKGSNNSKETKEDLDEIQKLQKEITDLISKQAYYAEKYPDWLGKQLQIKNELVKKEYELREAKGIKLGGLSLVNTDIMDAERDLTLYEKIDLSKQIQEQQEAAALKIVSNFSEGLSLAQQISNVLNFGADSFIGKLLNGLQSTFNLANSVIGFISGLANISSGGIFSSIFSFLGFANGTNFAPGGLSLVGERGMELVNLPRGSQVYNNAETMRILNNQNLSSNKIYIGSNMPGVEWFEITENQYKQMQKSRQVA